MLIFSLKKKKYIDTGKLVEWIIRCQGDESDINTQRVAKQFDMTLSALAQEWRRNPKGVIALLTDGV